MSAVKTLATVVERPREANFREVTLTPKHDDTVVCKTRMSAISTGTDLKTYLGKQHPEQCFYPLVPGYENMGVVVEEGSYAPGLKKGSRVMINECRRYQDCCAAWGGGTLMVHKDSFTAGGAGDMMCAIPDNVTDEQAVLAYLACVPFKGVQRFDLRPTDTVVVSGAGMVGVSAMQLLKIKCPGVRVIALEVHPFRQEIARQFADEVIHPDDMKAFKDLTNGRGADKIIECSGNPEVPGMLYRYLKAGGWFDDDEPGHIHLNGDYPEKLVFDHYHRWFGSHATITMSCAIKSNDKPKLLQYIAEGKFRTDLLPIEVWPAGKAKEAFEYAHKKGPEVFKILFDWRDL